MLAALTGLGLSAAAGLNAFIPFLVVGLAARFTDLVVLPTGWEWLTSWWAIGAAAVLLVVEVVVDKVPALDSVNDAVQTVVRPAVGGLVFAASTAAARLDASTWVRDRPWVGVVAGIVVAGLVHATKATARPMVNAATLGAGAPVVSAVEDGASVGLSLVAVVVPALVVVALALAGWVLWRLWRRRRRGRAAPPGAAPPPEPAP
jgi:uncharacterized membrane protein